MDAERDRNALKSFTLEIEVGNAAMTGDDVADALNHVAAQLRQGYELAPIFDSNGNHAGYWRAA